jgi:hypothetical protein
MYVILRRVQNVISLCKSLKIFGPKRDEVTGQRRRQQSEELHDLYSSPNINQIIKSRRMRWAGYVARIGEMCIQDFGG